MRIFKLVGGEYTDYFGGKTLVDAILGYLYDTELEISDLNNTQDIEEVSDKEWETLRFQVKDELGSTNLLDWVQNNKEAGFICSTAY